MCFLSRARQRGLIKKNCATFRAERRKLENIGKLKAMVHPQAKSGVQRNQVFAITEHSALASINLASGEINWRNTVPAGESFDSLRLYGKHLLTLSGGGKFVRVWNAQDGTLEWDATTCLAGGTPSNYDAVFTGADVDGDGIEEVALLCDNSVQLRSGGALIWDSLVESGKGNLGSLSIDGASSISDLPMLTVAGRGTGAGGGSDDDMAAAGGDELVTVSFDLTTGSEESYEAAEPPDGGVTSGPGLRIGDGWFVSVGGGGRSLLVLDAQKAKIHSFATADLLPKGSSASEIWVETTSVDFHVVLHGAQAAVLRVDTSGTVDVKAVHTFSMTGAVVASAKDGEAARVTAVSVTESGTEAEVLTLSDGGSSERYSFSAPTLASAGMAQSARSVLTTKRDGELAHRVILITADAAMHMLEPGDLEPKWVREEGLAEVSQAVFVDQVPMKGAAMDIPLSDLWAQISKVAAQLTGGSTARVTKERTAGWYERGERFGLRKLGIVVSAVGKVYALDVNDGGAVVWSHYFGGAPAGGSGSTVAVPTSVEYSVVISHPTLGDEAARGVVVAKGTDSTFLASFNAISGEVDPAEVVSETIVHMGLAPEHIRMDDGTRLIYMVDDSSHAHVFPSSPAAKAFYAAKIAPITFYYLVEKDDARLTGYQLPDVATSESPAPAPLWTLQFSGETVETFASRPADETVQSPVRILPDRSVMYKYLNPNLLLLATSAKAVDEDGSDVVNIYTIDSVTGRVLSRTQHVNAQGPVYAVCSENWVVYHYWSLERKGRWELGVIELYEGAESVLSAEKVVDVIRGTTEKDPFSSYTAKNPSVARQTMIFPHAVRSMKVTQTRYGVTLRNVLMALGSDQVYSLDKRFADPRAPVNVQPTMEEREEGVIPYQAVIPVPPNRLLTYNQTIVGLRFLETAPARLESICHVFAIGLDIFYTRTSPSRSFDLLAEDFDYLVLLFFVAGLAGLTTLAWWQSKNKDLNSAWR